MKEFRIICNKIIILCIFVLLGIEMNTITVRAAQKNGVCQGEDAGWYYYENEKIDTTYTGVAHNANGWWYVKDGKVDFNYDGLGTNENGIGYIDYRL